MKSPDFGNIDGENPFYCKDAAFDWFLLPESVDLFIGHPPYYMEELELNGGDPEKQMQKAESLEEYWDRFVSCMLHMEQALKPNGHIFVALQNTSLGLGVLPGIAKKTGLELQSIRMWDYSENVGDMGNNTAVFAHYTKKTWGAGDSPQGPFILRNLWKEATEELSKYHSDYSTVGASPMGLYGELITNFSKEGDVVVDLFAGCGTVQLVALKLGRKFIFNDVSEEKLLVAKKRIEDYLTSQKNI